MMKISSLLLSLLFTCLLTAQTYTWKRGDYIVGNFGTYGTMGTFSSGNDPGGRHGAAQWMDKSGNLWIMGGEGHSGSSTPCWLNDLWKYDRTLNQWAWMRGSTSCDPGGTYGTQGVAAPGNDPGGREFSQCWTDTAGNFWVLGGTGYAGTSFGILNDLWKYNPQTNQWTWMKGTNNVGVNGVYGTLGVSASTNMPGSRHGGATWTGNDGHLYLFGGRGFGATGFSNFLSDVWRYNISTNEWTWIKGPNQNMQPGTYGTIGVAAPANTPGGREFPSSWKDAQGNFYLFGGRGQGYFNDLWKFDLATSNWTWVHGANIANQKGGYGTMGVPSATTVPGGRLNGSGWTDIGGNFWLFGGQGWSATTLNLLNDLWKYDPCSNEWTWMKGSDTTNQYGSYGVQNVPSVNNQPGSRMYYNAWTDSNGKFWLFGGEGFDSSSVSIGHINDMWTLEVPLPADSIGASSKMVCSGKTVTLSVNTNYSPVNWYHGTSTAVVATGTTYVTPTLTTTSVFRAQVNCPGKPKTVTTITVLPLPAIAAFFDKDDICLGESAILAASGAVTYSLSGQAMSNPATVSPNVSTIYTVTGADQNGCTNSTMVVLNVSICTDQQHLAGTEPIRLYPNPASGELRVTNLRSASAELIIYDSQAKQVLITQLKESENIQLNIEAGLYFYEITTTGEKVTGKLIIQ